MEKGQALLLRRNGAANVLDHAVVFFQHEAQRSRGMFTFGKSRHKILIIQINVIKIPGDPTKPIPE